VGKFVALLIVAALVVGALLLREEPPQVVEAPPPEVMAPQVLPDAAPVPPRPAVAVPSSALLQNGFCAPTGVESFVIRRTLEGVVLAELRRRVASREPSVLLRETLDAHTAPELRWRQAQDLAAQAPDSAPAQALLAIAARATGRADDELAALRRARALAPDEPAIAWALADATRNSADLDEAIAGLGTYLAIEPMPELSRLRARLELQRDLQRDYLRQSRDGLTLLWPPGALTPTQLDDVAATIDRALDEAAALTGTTRRRSLTIVIYPSRSELLAVSCARNWTVGLYDGTLRLVAERLSGVERHQLRHETLHAQLTPIVPNAPKWFHEGLAQSFAKERWPLGKWKLMVRTKAYAPFSSLDGTFQAFDADGDAELVYAQSYAMVELMRDLGGDGSIAAAITAFQAGADTSTAMAAACRKREVSGDDLLGFLERRLSR
jgi:tetratricopeptide (TPR) repeat protein